ncbi:MAG: LamG-like jellyroll fold domain-containing protein [Melioribacteraceae bacterium]|nr:LamG-like jellyroll fold domain-containing protein [Melioribacteraceae bacterium]
MRERNIIKFMTLLFFNFMINYPPITISAQRVVQVPQGVGTLDAVVRGDTLQNGQRVDPNTIYELSRGGYYITMSSLENRDYHLHIRAAAGSGKKPIIRPGVSGGGTSNRPFQARANLTLDGVYVTNLDEQNALLQNIIRLSADNVKLTILNSHLDRDLQSAIRCDAKNQKVIIKNSIISNIGSMQSPDNGRGVDDRGNDIDTLIYENNTWYNITSRILRDGGGIIKYAWINHNTVVNVTQWGCSIGPAIEAHFRNNLFINTGFIGRSSTQLWFMLDTAPLTQAWLDQGFIQKLMIHNNSFYVDPDITLSIPADRTPTPVMNEHTLAAVNAGGWASTIKSENVSFTKSPGNPKNVMLDYFDAAVTVKTDMDKGGGTPEFGQTQMPFDFSYSTVSSLYTSATNGFPLGDLNWFPSKILEWGPNTPTQQYSIITSSNPSIGGTASGGGTFNNGSYITVSATPNTGYIFLNWTENGIVVSTNSSYTLTVTINRNLVANFTGIVAYYPFNGNANDQSGNGINGTVFGASLTTDRFGVANRAYSFDGTGNFIKGSATNLPTGERTISLWFNANSVSNQPNLFGYGGSSVCGTSFQMGLNIGGYGPSNTYHVQSHCGVNLLSWVYPQAPTNQWHHWVVTTSANNTSIYVDGILVASNNNFINNTVAYGKDFCFGVNVSSQGTGPYVDQNNGYFNGKLDDIKIYNHVISESEIKSLYHEGGWQQSTITTSSNPSNGGTTGGGGNYDNGVNATITAVPSTGYSFVSWTENGVVVSTNSNYTFTVSGNRTLVANFEALPYTITTSSNPVNGGVTTGGGVYYYGNSAAVTANPSQYFLFTNWTESGNVVSSNSNYTFTVTNNKTLVANFMTYPNPPVLSTASNITQTSFRITWTASANTVKYFLDVAIDNQFNNILSNYNNRDVGNVTSFMVTGVTANATFYCRLRAYNAIGFSGNSNVVAVTTLPNAPSAPVAITATDLKETSFTAKWNASSGATGYYLDIAIDGSFNSILSNYNNKDVGNVISYSVTGLATNFTYYYRVRAYNTGGTSGNSNTITVTIVTHVDEDNLPAEFVLHQNYPNPFNPSTIIQFSIPKEIHVVLNVYNALGEIIAELLNRSLSPATYSIRFDATDLPNGIYFYKIQAGEFVQTKKMILMK